jgi:hypothetical protein
VQITRIIILEVLKGKAKTMFSPNCRKTSGTGLIVGCAGCICHNTVQAATYILPVDVGMIVSKVYLYFKYYTELKL